MATKLEPRLIGVLLLASILSVAACSDSPMEPEVPAVEAPSDPTNPPVPATPTPGRYSITIRYIATATPRQQQAVASAVKRWESVITRDLADIPIKAPAGGCFQTQPALNERIDDMLILVEFVNIDGPGMILGEAGPCYIRGETSLPVVGQLRLDASDLARMEAQGTIDDVVLHEIGHVLGIGTLWTDRNLITGAGSADPQFIGGNAIAAYRGLGGVLPAVPIENTGAAGTRDGHWRESVFGSELMTGWISIGGNPMSAMTIASLQDLGYGADQSVASAYTINRTMASMQGDTAASRHTYVDLHGREKIKRPKFKVDRHGRIEHHGKTF